MYILHVYVYIQYIMHTAKRSPKNVVGSQPVLGQLRGRQWEPRRLQSYPLTLCYWEVDPPVMTNIAVENHRKTHRKTIGNGGLMGFKWI